MIWFVLVVPVVVVVLRVLVVAFRIAMVQVVTKPSGVRWVDFGLVEIGFGLVGPLPPGVLAESPDWAGELVVLGV